MIKLQVKIILWVFIILARFLCALKIEYINSNDLLAFSDFLRSEHLKHALLPRFPGRKQSRTWESESYGKLLANYTVQFFTPRMSENITELFYQEAPRTAILVEIFESGHAKRGMLQAASDSGYFNNRVAWFMVGNSQTNRTDESIIVEHLSAYSINIDADITVAMRSKANWLQLYDVYGLVGGDQQTALRIESKGMWSPSDGYRISPEYQSSSWRRRRSNLANITLIGSTVLTEKPSGYDDYSYLSNDGQFLQLDPMQRKTFQLFSLMAQLYNLSFDVRLTDNWGQLLQNGTWSGVMGHITNGEADFALCPIRFVLDRQHYVQYSPVLHTQLIHFVFRHPRRNSIRNIFFEPLSPRVWWCVLALVACTTLLLPLHIGQEQRQSKQQQKRRVRAEIAAEGQVAFGWFTIMETYLQQGPAVDLFKLPSTRVLISTSCIFSFMLMQFYGAFIVGSLLSETQRSIVNLQALHQSSLEIGMENISYNYGLFTNTTNQLVRDVYTERICARSQLNILDIHQGALRIKSGGFAFHAAIDRIYRLLIDLLDEKEFCELQEVMFNPPYVAASIMPKNSPYREHIAHAILHLSETGLLQYNDKKWSISKPDCSLVKATEVEVDLEHFAPALFALLLAMMGSSVVFLVEMGLKFRVSGKWPPKAFATEEKEEKAKCSTLFGYI